MSRLRVARSAVSDLGEIWSYIAKRESVDAAERLLEFLTKRFALLAQHPGAGRKRDDLRAGLRSLPVGSYRIYYRQEKEGVVRILHVRHAARDEKALR
jgi:toxin ParE1/3/4